MNAVPGRWTMIVAVVVVMVAALTGCGSGGKSGSDTAGKASVAPAGAAPLNYKLTGKLVADDGFRPKTDGFSFENYGNDIDPENMTPANMEALFGAQVCTTGTGDKCVLTPPGQAWMDEQNDAMGGGHCMGFSVLALRLFAQAIKPSDLEDGAKTTHDLAGDDPAVQNQLAEAYSYQSIPAIVKAETIGSPNDILDFLIKHLSTAKELYTLGIYLKHGQGGHAVTPVAVEDMGGDKFKVLVYDNNYPDVLRPVSFDRGANTYEYVGGTNPSETDLLFGGDAESQIDLTPTLVGENVQPCPFCNGALLDGADKGSAGAARGTVLPKEEQFSELTLTGKVDNHPHLIVTDEKSRQSGTVGGKLINDIPGVRLVRRFSDKPGGAIAEPKFQIPAGMSVEISIDGTDLKKTSTSKINFIGNGLVVSIEDIKTAPGQTDNVYLPGSGYGLEYENNSTGDVGATPQFFAGVDDGDTAYTFAGTAANLKKGATVGIIIDQKAGTVLLDSSDGKGKYTQKGFYGLVISKTDSHGERVWLDDNLELDGSKGEDAFFSYKDANFVTGKPLEYEVVPDKGPSRTRKALYQK